MFIHLYLFSNKLFLNKVQGGQNIINRFMRLVKKEQITVNQKSTILSNFVVYQYPTKLPKDTN